MTAADVAIITCERHLLNTHSLNTEVETYLVKYLLVLICSEFEEMILRAVEARAGSLTDAEIVAFIKSATAQLFRSLRISELSGLLGRFAPAIKDNFSSNVTDSAAHVAFDTLINNRMQVAHSTGVVNLTFGELKLRYEESKDVVRYFATALNVAHPC